MIRITALAALMIFAVNVHAAKGGKKPGEDLGPEVAQLKVDVQELQAVDAAIEGDITQLQSDTATTQAALSTVQVDVSQPLPGHWSRKSEPSATSSSHNG